MGFCSSDEQGEGAVLHIDADDVSINDSQPFVTALARGLAVIRAFGRDPAEPTLTDLAKATELPRATVRRCVHTLVGLGYAQSDGRHFSLTPKILTLGYAYLSTASLPRVAQPFLERISESCNESCSLSILEGDEVVYLARSARKRIMSVDLSVGSLLPAYCTSMGRVLLAALPEDEVCNRLARAKLEQFTPHTIVDPDALREILNGVRRQGFALVDQELEVGLRSLAVPVFGAGGKVVAAMNVSAQAGRVDIVQLRGPLLDSLRLGVAELSAVLGGL